MTRRQQKYFLELIVHLTMRTIAVPVYVLSLLATLLSPTDSAFVIQSQDTNQWATALTRDAPLRRVMIVTTLFYDGNNAVTSAGAVDTDCQLLIAESPGVWVQVDFEDPKLCVGGALVREGNGGEAFFTGIVGAAVGYYSARLMNAANTEKAISDELH